MSNQADEIENEIEKGFCLVEFVGGVEGPCLSLGDRSTGTRLAGPKPWGGGRTIHSFIVDCRELIKEAMEYGQLTKDDVIAIVGGKS